MDPSGATSSSSTIVSTSTPNDTITEETDSSTATITIDSTETPNTTEFITTTTNTSGGCYPDGFPFFNDCISPDTNGIVVIIAFSLSILSFIGVIGVASYILFCRKYFSTKRSRLMTNYDVSQQAMKSSTTNDLTRSKVSSSNQRRNASRKKKLNNNAVRLQSTKMNQSRRVQKPNVSNKQREPPLDRSNKRKNY